MATDEAVIELDGSLGELARHPSSVAAERCLDPRGMALSEDESRTYLACRDGSIVEVPLDGGLPTRMRLAPEPPVDCSGLGDRPVPPLPAGRIVNADQAAQRLAHHHCRHPKLSNLIELGRTHQGRPVTALAIGVGAGAHHRKPTVLLNGAHHGSEPMSATFVLDAVRVLLEGSRQRIERWRDELVVVAVPYVNPDGNMARTTGRYSGRKNGRDTNGDGRSGPSEGVDLNRNYPFRWHSQGDRSSSSDIHSRYFRGPAPASEPETRAVMELAERERFVASISYHTGALALLAPYTIPLVKNPTPNDAWIVAEQVARQVRGHPEGVMAVRRNLYPVDGTDQDWLRHTHGTVALLIEGVSDWQKWQIRPRKQARIIEAVRASWTELLDRYLDGPSLHGRVLDAVGRPLQAEVRVAEVYLQEKERWTSRCRDGRYDRFLTKPGTYTLQVTLPSGESLQRRVEVGRERVRADVVMPVFVAEAADCAPQRDNRPQRSLLLPVAAPTDRP